MAHYRTKRTAFILAVGEVDPQSSGREDRQKEGQTSALLQGPTNASLHSSSFPKRWGQVRQEKLKSLQDKLWNQNCQGAQRWDTCSGKWVQRYKWRRSSSKVPLLAFSLLLVDGWSGAGRGFGLAFAPFSLSPLLIFTCIIICVWAVHR